MATPVDDDFEIEDSEDSWRPARLPSDWQPYPHNVPGLE